MSDMIERLKKINEEKGVQESYVACRLKRLLPDGDKDWKGVGKLHTLNCEICTEEIWVSDTSMKMKEIGAKFICDLCARLVSIGGQTYTVMTKEAFQSAKNDSGKSDEELLKRMQDWQKVHGTSGLGGVV